MKNYFTEAKFVFAVTIIIFQFLFAEYVYSQEQEENNKQIIDVSGFLDSAHHWYDITDNAQTFLPLKDQKRYKPTQVKKIADNILLYQQKNGGWPKNYDMLAILNDKQKAIIKEGRDSLHTGFDNGATYSQVEYLAKAYSKLKDGKFKGACLRGIKYILSAQYDNGGWPQFYPDTSGYRKFITFNDDAMVGIMNVLHHIVQNNSDFSFVDNDLRAKVEKAFEKGIDCILKCQIVENGKPTVWCQQHDNIDFHPQHARTFELPSKCGKESTGIVLLLMDIDKPSKQIINSIKDAVDWFKKSEIHGVRVKRIQAPEIIFKYRKSHTDKIIVNDSTAPPIWARFYSLKNNKPFFTDRNSVPVDTLSKVGRERRDGYSWYTYEPQKVLDAYPEWLRIVE